MYLLLEPTCLKSGLSSRVLNGIGVSSPSRLIIRIETGYSSWSELAKEKGSMMGMVPGILGSGSPWN